MISHEELETIKIISILLMLFDDPIADPSLTSDLPNSIFGSSSSIESLGELSNFLRVNCITELTPLHAPLIFVEPAHSPKQLHKGTIARQRTHDQQSNASSAACCTVVNPSGQLHVSDNEGVFGGEVLQAIQVSAVDLSDLVSVHLLFVAVYKLCEAIGLCDKVRDGHSSQRHASIEEAWQKRRHNFVAFLLQVLSLAVSVCDSGRQSNNMRIPELLSVIKQQLVSFIDQDKALVLNLTL